METSTNYEVIQSLHRDLDSDPPSAPFCYCSLLYCLVKTNGEIYPCSTMACKELHSVGNILRDRWSSICERQREFAFTHAGARNPACAGCMNDHKNLVLKEIVDCGIEAAPTLTRVGGIGSFFSRW